MKDCRCCHTCATELTVERDGDEWCGYCRTYRRYRSHGWESLFQLSIDEEKECPTEERLVELKARLSRKRGKKYNMGRGKVSPQEEASG